MFSNSVEERLFFIQYPPLFIHFFPSVIFLYLLIFVFIFFRINEICNMLRKQSEIMENMSQNPKREKEETEDQAKGERKLFSLMAF